MAEGIVPFKNLAKQQLLERCRELEFVDDVQDLRCTRCNRLALEHWYTNCGHALCPNYKRLLSGGRCRCPHCGLFIQHIENQNADFEEKVNGLRAKCPNSRYGCSLVTTVKQLQEHLVGCEWTKEQILPAVYRGANTMEMLLEEVSSLKEQMGDMNGTIGFLSNELQKRQEFEEEIKKSVEMSVEDIKSRLNGLSSDLHYETTSLKVQFKDFDQIKMKELLDLKNTLTLDIKNKIITLEKTMNEINHEKLKDHFMSKDEAMRLQETMAELKVSNKLLIQMMDRKEDIYSQKLTKEVEAMDAKIMTSEGRMEAALTNSRQGTSYISTDLQEKVEKSSEELKAQLQKLTSDLSQRLEQQETGFNQKLLNEINKEKTSLEMNGKEIHAKMEAIKSEIKKQEVALMRHIATNVQNMQERSQGSIEALRQQLVTVHSDGLNQEQLRCNQKLTEEIEALEEKMRSKEEEIDTKMNSKFQKQDVAVENYRKEIATIGRETQRLREEIVQSNMNTNEMEKKIVDWVSKLFSTEVQIIQKLNPQLNAIEAFNRGTAIEQVLTRKSSLQQLVDSFLFGSAQEKMVFESLCLKWTIKDKDLFIPIEQWSRDHVSDIFPVYGFQPKAKLKLTVDSYEDIRLHLCLLDEVREGQEVDIKPLPMVTFIIKDLSRRNRHLSRYSYRSFNSSLKYNQFGYEIWIEKSQWTALVSPRDKSMEVLFLVEPVTIMNKPLSVDGSMTETIEHYSRKLQMAKEGLIDGHWSPLFLSHAGGYRVAVRMRLDNSIGENKTVLVAGKCFLSGRMWLDESIGWNMRGLVAGICFLSGESDSELGREFAHETSVTLINQWDASKNITVKKQAKDTSFYWMDIATHDAVSSGGFLVNDSLTYHVTVQTIKL